MDYQIMVDWIKENPQVTRAEFEQKMAQVYRVADQPKLAVALRLAWQYGHSSGYQEIVSYFDEIVELLN